MFARLRPNKKDPSKQRLPNKKILLFLTVAILGMVILLRFLGWISSDERSLLPNVPGLALLEDSTSLVHTIPLPSQPFGADLFTAGLYTQTQGVFPKGTIVLVYTKNNNRFVEIDYLPHVNLQEYLSSFTYPREEIHLTKDQSVWMLTIDTKPRCIDYEDDIPNRCEISKQLIFELDGRLVVIAIDGKSATQGEVLEIAKSI